MSNSYCFILASSDERTDYLNECVRCLKNSRYADSDVFLYYQGTKTDLIEDSFFFKAVVYDKNLRGVFTPRYELMKRYAKDYDFTILIDDDLFVTKLTNYENCFKVFSIKKYFPVGVVTTPRDAKSVRNEVREQEIYQPLREYSVDGGMVFSKQGIKAILDYFKDKEKDYTEDMFWLLLYVKGYSLLMYYGSMARHQADVRGSQGEVTGYSKMRIEKPYVPICPEYFDDAPEVYCSWIKHKTNAIKTIKNINARGIAERIKNRKKLRGDLNGATCNRD